MKYAIKMEPEDSLKLESLHFSVESRTNLFERLVTGVERTSLNSFYESFMKEYENIYREYVEFKEYIEKKYKPEEIKATAKNWYADFPEETIVFEV